MMMTTLHRRPSYSQTLEETLLEYGNDRTTTITIHMDRIKTNASDQRNNQEDDHEDDDEDDNQTTTTNGPICIDDGTSYDGNDDSDDDDKGSVDDELGGGGIIGKIRADAHSPIDEILIFSDVENSSDDENDHDNDDEEASLSQRSYENDPYGRFYKTSAASATSLLSLLNFDNRTKQDTKHSANIFKSFTSTQSTKAHGDIPSEDDQPSNLTKHPSLRRDASVSSTSSSLYDDIEEQAWIEFQQQSFDNGDTQAFQYRPSTTTLLSSLSSKNILSLPQIHNNDDDDNYANRMDNVRSLDCKNIGSNNNNETLVLQYDDLQRQRQLWDRIQNLPLAQRTSSSSSSTKKQTPFATPTTASSHLARQKVEL